MVAIGGVAEVPLLVNGAHRNARNRGRKSEELTSVERRETGCDKVGASMWARVGAIT